MMKSPLVSSEWLDENRKDENLVILDASTLTNVSGRKPEFENQVIPSAKHFDLKNVFSDSSSIYPNTFPTIEKFENSCQELGINVSSRIIIYDNLGIYTSPRVWWMFKTMGHDDVAVLNGGFPDWIKNGFETQTSYASVEKRGNFTCQLRSNRIVDIEFIQENIDQQHHLLIDARSKERFNETGKEPRAGLRSGHIPNSENLPFKQVLSEGYYKPEAELKELFGTICTDERPIIFTCGSGITACILLLGAELVLKNEKSIYDGSWTEWASEKKE